ncbi:MAG: hypothetical protein WD733_16455 [Bryobacterales bacterium]
MRNLSTVESPPASPPSSGGKASGKPSPRARQAARDAAETGSSFSIQGALGFLAGGLISLIFIGASALEPFESFGVLARVAGYGIGGALGGIALVWGSVRKHACRSAAFGFALAFLIPAWLAGPAVNRLLTVKLEAYGIGTFFATAVAFTIAFGVAGAIGGAFVMPRLFWAGMVRFGLAAAVGAAVAATVPSFNLQGTSVTPQHLVGLVGALILGHLIPFVLGGYLFGRAVETEERLLRANRRIVHY